jgi:hypothetical protein
MVGQAVHPRLAGRAGAEMMPYLEEIRYAEVPGE